MENLTLHNGVQMPLEGFGVFQVPNADVCRQAVLDAIRTGYRLDAISSASVTEVNGEAKGLVRTIAEDIQTVTGGDLFSIETSVDYPGDIDDLIEYVVGEQDEDVHPELISHIENLDEYDTIFVGYPNMEYGFDCVLCA